MHRGRWSCVASAPVHKNPARLKKFLSQDQSHTRDFTGLKYNTETTPSPQARRKEWQPEHAGRPSDQTPLAECCQTTHCDRINRRIKLAHLGDPARIFPLASTATAFNRVVLLEKLLNRYPSPSKVASNSPGWARAALARESNTIKTEPKQARENELRLIEALYTVDRILTCLAL